MNAVKYNDCVNMTKYFQLPPRVWIWNEQSVKATDLPGLHLLGAPSEGHIGITGAGAVPFLLLDGGDEGVGLAVFPLAAPVVKHLLDELVVLLQQQFGLRKAHQLRNTDRSYISDKRDAFKQT